MKKWAERQVIVKINGTAPGESPEWKISRIDLAADIAGIEFKPRDLERLTSRAIYRRSHHPDDNSAIEHHRGRVFTGFSIGKRGAPLHARIYLKTREADDDAFIRDEWERNGYDSARDGEVWRVEFEIRRKLLRELERSDEAGLSNDPEENLIDDLDDLWNYCVDEWLVLRAKKGSKRMTRRATEQWWASLAQLEGLSGSGKESKPLARRSARPAQADKQLDRALTSLVGYAVSTGTNDFGQVAAELADFVEGRGGATGFSRRVIQRRGSPE
ncbi:MAG TPA: hypothetical protein PKD76_12440 [Solirubrobacterales bacterium]|nr:hypothetical protein [Solirubrobacterales bacterium]